MKRHRLGTSLLLLAIAAAAADYSLYSTDALLKLRGTLSSPQEERKVHQELQKRLPLMSDEELNHYLTPASERKKRGLGDGRIKSH